MKVDIKHFVDMLDGILGLHYFFEPHVAHGWPLPGQKSGLERLIPALHDLLTCKLVPHN